MTAKSAAAGQLSPNFTVAEFVRSATATHLRIPNKPDAGQIAAMRTLCVKVLEPLRAHFRLPIAISSGYRSPALSEAVGSSKSSQHCLGEAADFEIAGISNFVVASWIKDNLPFDQLILENYVRGQPNSGWIHVSYREGRLRREALTYSRRTYFKGLLS